MLVDSPGSDVLIDHFAAIGGFLREQQTEAMANFEYLSTGSRSRLLKYERSISNELNHLFFAAHSFSENGLTEAYYSGWRGVHGKERFTVPAEGLARMDAIREQYRQRLNEMERFVRQDTRRFTNTIRKSSAEDLAQRAKGNLDRNLGIKTVEQAVQTKGGGVAQRNYRLSDYGKMQTKSATQRSFNTGTIDGAEAKGVELLEVDDGPGCGWTSHHDPEKANGRIVTIDEARSYPLAHPNCQRTFIPRPDLKEKPGKDKESRLSRKEKVAALAATSVAAGIGARVLFQVETEIIDPKMVLENNQVTRVGLVYQRAFNSLVDRFHPLGIARQDADIFTLPFYAEPPPTPTELPLAVGGDGVFPTASQAQAWKAAGPPNLADFKDSVQSWGTSFMDHRFSLPEMPDWVKTAIKATNSDDEEGIRNKFMLFSQWVNSTRIKETGINNLANVLNFQLKRRQWNEFTILKNLADRDLSSSVRATWTKYGPRVGIDLTDYFRPKLTFTKSGLRRSITFNPRGNLRSMLALSQDGTLMGALRLVPNRMFRAIVETDEFGKISGNVRLVPKNFPFKVKLTFGTPRLKFVTSETMAPGFSLVDLRPKVLSLDLEEAAKANWISPSVLEELRAGYPDVLDVQELSESALAILRKEHPGAEFIFVRKAEAGRDFVDTRLLSLQDFSFREIYGQLSQMQLKDIVFEMPIVKNTPLQISKEVKIPVSKVRESLERLAQDGFVDKHGTGWTGVFSWTPSEAAIEELQNIISASGLKVNGSIKFSSLNTSFSSILPDIKARAYFQDAKFGEVLTSIRISGITAIREASNLEIFQAIFELPEKMWADFVNVSDEITSRILLFMRRNNISQPWEIPNYFERRIGLLEAETGEQYNKASLYKGVVEAIRGQSDANVLEIARTKAKRSHKILVGGPTHQSWLRILANILPSDSQAAVELKLQDMIWFMRSMNLDDPSIIESLDAISDQTVHLASVSLTKGNPGITGISKTP